METQSDSIDITNIRSAALGAIEATDFQPDVSKESQIQVIHHDFQRSIAAATQTSNISNALLTAVSQPERHAAGQNTLSYLPTTVPDSQAILEFQASLHSISDAVNAKDSGRKKKMSTQGSAPQDTQPVSQSVYESIISKAKSIQQPKEVRDDHHDPENPQNTLQKGDEGHIDLFSSYKSPESEIDEESESDPVDFSPTQTQHHLPLFAESQRFKTPGTVGKKRDYNGELVETPYLPRNPLARSGGPTPAKLMGLSQVFAATQAISSPFLNPPAGDLMSDRPSPNIELQTRPATASLSSPLRPRSEFRRTATEPYSNYKSIKQSQADRERLAAFQNYGEEEKEDSPSDDEFEEESSLVERRRRQKEREDRVRRQFQSISSPKRASSIENLTPSHLVAPSLRRSSLQSSPEVRAANFRSLHGDVEDFDRQMTGELEPELESEEETEQEDEFHIAVKRSSQTALHSDEDKENDGNIALPIPETIARPQQRGPLNSDNMTSPSVRFIENQARTEEALSQAPEQFAVADSQSSQSARKAKERITLPSSGDGPSFVPQSQVTSNGAQGDNETRPLNDRVPSRRPRDRVEAAVVTGDRTRGTQERSLEDSVNAKPSEQQKDDGESTEYTMLPSRQMSDLAGMSEVSGAGVKTRRFTSRNLPRTESVVTETSSLNRQISDVLPTSKYSAKSVSTALPSSPHKKEVSNSSTDFETAHTRLEAPGSVSLPPPSSYVLASPSGNKRRRLTEIAADPSPLEFATDFDMDAAMATVNDKEFEIIAGSSSPIAPGRLVKRIRMNEIQSKAFAADDSQRDSGRGRGKQKGSSQEIEQVEFEKPEQTRTTLNISDTSGRGHGDSPPTISIGNVNDPSAPSESSPIRKRSKRPSRHTESLWDIEASPPRPALLKKKTKGSTSEKLPTKLRPEKSRPLDAVGSARLTSPRKAAHGPEQEKTGSSASKSPSQIGLGTSLVDNVTANGPLGEVIAPNQVFACFNGKIRAYYPATCLDVIPFDPPRYQIQWEGYEPDLIDAHGVCQLNLRIGDAIKINLKGFPKVPHLIRGFKDQLATPAKNGPMTDIRGYQTLLVTPKQRKSTSVELETEAFKEVPISAIYLDSNMWGQMKGRDFQFTPVANQQKSGFATPLDRPSTPSTPPSRRRRGPTLHSTAEAAVESVNGIFSNMSFALSYNDFSIKNDLENLICKNGGNVLSAGFHELFDIPAATDEDADEVCMNLQPHLVNLGFAALLAQRYSRKEKYMQALALNLPCLSGKWVERCVSKNELVDWRPFLLPAGESDMLEGAVRSRILPQMVSSGESRLADVVEGRPNLLKSESIVMVMGRGKAEAKRRPYLFLARAMGAGRITQVVDLKEAKRVIDADTNGGKDGKSRANFKWVFVDDNVDAATKELLGERRSASNASLRIVGNDFVCQSLILGCLYDG